MPRLTLLGQNGGSGVSDAGVIESILCAHATNSNLAILLKGGGGKIAVTTTDVIKFTFHTRHNA